LITKTLPPRQSIGWVNGKIHYIDQRFLPDELRIVETDDWKSIAEAIKTLAVRGAPLVGISAAYAVALASIASQDDIRQVIDSLTATRPTAVNLIWALNRMTKIVDKECNGDKLGKVLLSEAISIHKDDQGRCKAIGENGQAVVPYKCNILTICNTGFLATGGEGTAAAIFYQAHDLGKNIHIYAPETRPLLQGARLTVWEITQADIPVTLMVDSAAAGLVAKGEIDLCIIGADRIAANGDTVNKIGSYQLALACRAHDIPFYVAAPMSTVDISCQNGEMIPIEERDPLEVTDIGDKRISAKGASVYNPAFDLVPVDLITGIITEKGVLKPPYQFNKHITTES